LNTYRRMLLLWLVLLISACSLVDSTPAVVTVDSPGTATPIPDKSETPDTAVRHLVILYTNDEHGWMEGVEEGRGAANMMGLWQEQEGYREDGPYLVLSGGDNWTGPAISSWFDGESMVDVMNAMGYDAAAIGNHEFDFGLEGLRERAAQLEFPLLSANIRDTETGEIAALALPYVIQEVNGVQVGLIGLTTMETPETTNPQNVAGLDFIAYPDALAEVAPQARAEGAELLLVVGHLCEDDRRWLVSTAAELGVALIGGGHCHQKGVEIVDGVALVESGSYLEGYVRVDIDFDTGTDTVTQIEARYHENSGGPADSEIAAVVAGWRARTDETLTEVIGYLEKPIINRSHAMINLVTNAWLAAYPAADIALTNTGGFRQDIPAGEITLETIIGVLPFDNVLIDAELTGAEIVRNIVCCQPVAGGLTTVGKHELSDGTPLDPEATYHVLVNDFMYAGGDGFMFQEQDPDAYNTSIDWRQPVIDWILSLNTSPENPLDGYLDTENRQW
jgi:5'-nucleotidase/UDP-sugar diphosphatase